jgi:uncharacterized protein
LRRVSQCMAKKAKWKIIKRYATVLLILGVLFFHFYMPRFITEIKNPLVELIKGNHDNTVPRTFENDKLKGKHIRFKSYDGTMLSSYLTYSTTDTAKGTIILLHGIRSSKECFIELSTKLSALGYNSIALDSRAHGQSEGVHCTFGVKEKKDVSALIDVLTSQLSEEEKSTQNIGVWGQSLGGAIGLQALGTDGRIKYGIIESTFSDFNSITHDYFDYHLGFNAKPIINYLIYRAGIVADFNPDEAKPIQYCSSIHQSLLLVHGDKDKRIDIKYAKTNFKKINSKNKEFVLVKNANHLNVWEVGADKYFEKVIRFIENSI